MEIIKFDPSIHSWKDIVLNSEYPIICCYGNITNELKKLKCIYEKCKFTSVEMKNFDEDDPNVPTFPSYIVFNKGDVIGNFSSTDENLIDKIIKCIEDLSKN